MCFFELVKTGFWGKCNIVMILILDVLHFIEALVAVHSIIT